MVACVMQAACITYLITSTSMQAACITYLITSTSL